MSTVELSQAAYDELKEKLGATNLLNMDGVSITRSMTPGQVVSCFVVKKKLPPNLEWLAIECGVSDDLFSPAQEVMITVTPK